MPGELQIPQWEWWIVLYFFVGGIAGGAYFTSAVVELVGEPAGRPIARMGYYLAFPLAVLSGLFLILDLGSPLRFWHMLIYRQTLLPWPVFDSPISIGSYGLLVFSLFSFLSLLDTLVETGRLPWAPLRLRYNSLPRKIYAILGGIAGFFLASYTVVLLATGHLPMWASTPLLGALFIASGASTGMAAIALLLHLTRTPLAASAWAKLQRLDLIAVVVELVLLIAYAGALTLQGFNWSLGTVVLLLGVTLLMGLIAPLVINLLAGGARPAPALRLSAVTALLILLGGFAMRMAIVLGGQGFI
jgi:formate-dependent nitrite reductase membrane component NrfD